MDMTPNIFIFVFFAMFAFAALLVIAFFVVVVRPWMRTFFHGLPVSIIQIIAMRLRGNSPSLLIDSYISLKRAKVMTTIEDVENVYIDARNRILTSDDLVKLVTAGAQTRPPMGRTWR